MPQPSNKTSGRLIEFLDQGRLRPGLIVREQGERLSVLGADGREKQIARDLVLVRHSARNVEPANLGATLAELEAERSRMAAELDLKLLWEVVRDQGGAYSAEELAELFYGQRSPVATTVVLDALLNDRLYFIRRHLEFIPNTAERVERIALQQERTRLRSDENRRLQALVRDLIVNDIAAGAEANAPLVEQLRKYLENPSTRSNDLTALLSAAVPDLPPAETAYEVLQRLGVPLSAPRYVLIGGIRTQFSAAVMEEAHNVRPPAHRAGDALFSMSIDDEETVEIDDALACQALPDGGLRVLIHIALVADWVSRGGPMDREAALRGATVYLPEATIRMLPDPISCGAASLIAGQERCVLTTDVRLRPDATVADFRIYPAAITVDARLSYTQADALIAGCGGDQAAAHTLKLLHAMADRLREWRRRAGAVLIRRREAKVRVHGDTIDINVIETDTPSRLTVAEYMILSNHLAAQFCAAHAVPIIYRVQPSSGGDVVSQHPRLSLYPALHTGIGLEHYAQLSSPIRRYADLVLQRQLVGFLADAGRSPYQTEELLTVLANAEAADTEAKELERRSKRYWSLRLLQQRVRPDDLLIASVLREGATAELTDYALRGTLRGAPNLANDTRVMVRIASLDPLRGWLAMEYAGPAGV